MKETKSQTLNHSFYLELYRYIKAFLKLSSSSSLLIPQLILYSIFEVAGERGVVAVTMGHRSSPIHAGSLVVELRTGKFWKSKGGAGRRKQFIPFFFFGGHDQPLKWNERITRIGAIWNFWISGQYKDYRLQYLAEGTWKFTWLTLSFAGNFPNESFGLYWGLITPFCVTFVESSAMKLEQGEEAIAESQIRWWDALPQESGTEQWVVET